MRRLLALAVGTVAGLVALFAYPTSRNATVEPSGSAVEAAPATQGDGSASSSADGSSDGSTDAAGGPDSTSGAASDGASGTTAADGTYTGAAVDTRWGPVQVQIVVQGGRITSADAVVYPDENGHDRQINAYAIPLLDESAVSAQSAQIDLVSGATVTSQGYVQSLQDAIDQAFS